MTESIRYVVSALLVLSFGLLGSLVPGGPIENRDFSHIDPFVLGAFNTFLTTLVIVSVLLVYYILKNMRWAFVASVLCGVSYFLVYILDLGKIFPVSPDSMPQALFVIEVLGTIVSLPLTFASIQGAIKAEKRVMQSDVYSKSFVYLAFLLVVVGVGIITFATKSAIGNA